RLDCTLRAIVADHDLEFYFWKEIHCVLGATINLAVPLLPAKSFYLTQSHSFDACRDQSFSHRLGFEWLNDGLDFFHRAKLNAAVFEMASSASVRYKEQIKPMNKASETVFALKPVTFRYKKEIDQSQNLEYGLIAEEVAKVDSNLAIRDRNGQIEIGD